MGIRHRFRQGLQALLFPQSCVLCAGWTVDNNGSPLCRRCLDSLPALRGPLCHFCGHPVQESAFRPLAVCTDCRNAPRPFDFARSFGPYRGGLRTLIQEFKFRGSRRLASPLAELLVRCLGAARLDLCPDWILPVPLFRSRLKRRGFDQTLLLSREVSRSLDTPLFQGLVRIRETLPMADLTCKERRKNLRGAFDLLNPQPMEGRCVLLIDDVMTTGSTVSEISTLLRNRIPIRNILVLTVARAVLMYNETPQSRYDSVEK